MDSVTAAEWLQCLTSKLRCCSIFSAWKVLWLLWKTPGRNFMIALKNTREEFHDLLWKTPGRKRRRKPMTWRPFPSSPPLTMSDIQRALICNFFRISIIMIDNIMISSINSSPPSTMSDIQRALDLYHYNRQHVDQQHQMKSIINYNHTICSIPQQPQYS